MTGPSAPYVPPGVAARRRRRPRRSLAVLLLGLLLAALGPAASGSNHGRWLVTADSPEAVTAALAAVGIDHAPGALPTAAASLAPRQRAALAADPRVRAVEPDVPATLEATQTDAPWNLDRIDQVTQPLSGTYSWEEDGGGVLAYVVDTGVRTTHDEFEGRVRSGHSVLGGTTQDCHGHGTLVAGLVAGTRVGVAKAVEVVPVRVFGCSGGGSSADIIAGLEWIATEHRPGRPGVVNLSLSTPASVAVDTATRELLELGLTVVAAAGNQGGDACLRSPARVPGVVTVGSTDISDFLARSTNTGSCVDLYAPGDGVPSASHTADDELAPARGTSMAAAHASGTTARVLSRPGWATAGGAATARVVGLEAVPRAGAASELLLQAPPTTPAPAPGDRTGVVRPGTAAVGPSRSAPGGGCVRTDGATVQVPLDLPRRAVVERVEVLGGTRPGTARLRATTWADDGPRLHTLATLRSGNAPATGRTTWSGADGAVHLSWTPDTPAARLCTVRLVVRTRTDPGGTVLRLERPCVPLDTRGGAAPDEPIVVDVAAACGLPGTTAAVQVHVVAFAGTGSVVLGSGDGAVAVPRRGGDTTDPVLPVPLDGGGVRVDADGAHVRLVVLATHATPPAPPAPAWAVP